MSKKFWTVAIIIGVSGGLLYGLLADRIERVVVSLSLFSGAEQYENFPRLQEFFPVSELSPSSSQVQFEKATPITLPAQFIFDGQVIKVPEFLDMTDSVALLVLKQGKIVYEQYWRTGGADVGWLSMSVAKSFISTLIGIAVAEGHIQTIQQPVTAYVPELIGSAYEGVRIKDILQMSSGAKWDEDYNDPDSDINRFSRIFALGGSLDEFVATLENERPAGTYNQYNSVDTQVLGMLLTRATGQSVTAYMQEKLWQPIGAQDRAYWLVDSNNMEMVFGGLIATARDYAKLGELYRLKGRFNGHQIVPTAWVKAATKPDAPHLMAGDNPASDYPLGYGYQWWVPEGEAGEFTAVGVYNQFIYVAPKNDIVIVKLSANSDYGVTDTEASNREFTTLEFFRAIAAQ